MAPRGPHILVIGYNAFDVVVAVSELPQPDAKQAVSRILFGGGGPGATAAVALARLGARVRLVTVLTDDLPGRLQRGELQQAGVDLSLCPDAPGHESPKAVILVDPDRQERTIFWSRGDLPALDADLVAPDWLAGVDLLYCDGHECAAAARLAGLARQRNLPVVMDLKLDKSIGTSGRKDLTFTWSDLAPCRGYHLYESHSPRATFRPISGYLAQPGFTKLDGWGGYTGSAYFLVQLD